MGLTPPPLSSLSSQFNDGRYLEARFGSPTRVLASLAFSVQMILYMGIVLYAPSLALSAVTGLTFPGSVVAVGLVCTFYSSLGGMKAVLMTDVFQSLLMFAAIFAVIGELNINININIPPSHPDCNTTGSLQLC